LRNSDKINEFERKISANISDRMLIAHSVGLDQRSCATSDPVSTMMGDRLWTGKPSRYVTS